MRTQKRLEKISIVISLVGLALGFSVLGLLIVAKEHDGAALIASGILGILLGVAFLVAGCLHWKCFDQIQGKIQVEEVPATEIASEMRQAADAICRF
jgi:di/tricarboxylate transporter